MVRRSKTPAVFKSTLPPGHDQDMREAQGQRQKTLCSRTSGSSGTRYKRKMQTFGYGRGVDEKGSPRRVTPHEVKRTEDAGPRCMRKAPGSQNRTLFFLALHLRRDRTRERGRPAVGLAKRRPPPRSGYRSICGGHQRGESLGSATPARQARARLLLTDVPAAAAAG